MGKDLRGKELGEGICQKKCGRYEARFVDRFGNRRSISGKNLREVKQKFNEALYEDRQEINIRQDLSLDKWYEKWIGVHKFDVIRRNTQRHYNQIYSKHISPVLGKRYLKNITQLEIKALIKSLKQKGYKYETINKVRILLLDMFNKALTDQFVNRNPVKGITVVRDEEKEPRVLTVEEQVTFFDCCKGTFYDNFFVTAVSTGMRIGELAGLKWEDIDWKNRVINVNRTLVYQKYDDDEKKTFHIEKPKTKTSERKIPINKQCERALKSQRMQKFIVASKMPSTKKVEKEFEDFLFTTSFNTPLNSQIICDTIKKIVNEINLTRDVLDEMETFSCHAFRHTFAVRCFESGIAPKTVQTYLGHATLQMTMDLYTTVLEEFKESEMQKLENTLDALEDSSNNIFYEKYDEWDSKTGRKVVNIGDWSW